MLTMYTDHNKNNNIRTNQNPNNNPNNTQTQRKISLLHNCRDRVCILVKSVPGPVDCRIAGCVLTASATYTRYCTYLPTYHLLSCYIVPTLGMNIRQYIQLSSLWIHNNPYLCVRFHAKKTEITSIKDHKIHERMAQRFPNMVHIGLVPGARFRVESVQIRGVRG